LAKVFGGDATRSGPDSDVTFPLVDKGKRLTTGLR
jgi:hypothetical protein